MEMSIPSAGDENCGTAAPEKEVMHSALEHFLQKEGVAPEWYARQTAEAKTMPRYLRTFGDATMEEALAGFPGSHEVPWLPGFIAVPAETKVKGNDVYESARVQGMDAASGFAINMLDVKPGMKVLDLCCAPGAKFCMLADIMKRKGTLYGVDASLNRAQTCVSLCKKYRIAKEDTAEMGEKWECMLLQDDGVTFTNPWASSTILWCNEADRSLYSTKEVQDRNGKGAAQRKRLSKGVRKHLEASREKKRKLYLSGESVSDNAVGFGNESVTTFDRVLVDAECTHDGSIKHMAKYSEGGQFGPESLQSKFLEADNCKHSKSSENLEALQRSLLENGFRLLKEGGYLVYSTCSFCVSQNERIVQWLLEKETTAELVDVREHASAVPFVASEILPGTVKFEPCASKTSGLFMAKLRKKRITVVE